MIKQPTLPDKPTALQAAEFVRALTRWIGPGFHPDTRMSDYVEPDGQRCFSPTLAATLDDQLSAAVAALAEEGVDASSVALPVQRRMLRSLGVR